MNSTPKSDKHAQGDCESSPQTAGGYSFTGHKASFRSTKLARRARSFKEDILEKFSQIRSPGSTPGLRSQSPKSRSQNVDNLKQANNLTLEAHTTKELDIQLRQVQVALKHFRDVISKNKLEILPGNGTIVLETVSAIHTALKHCLLNNDGGKQNNALTTATHQVYKSLAQLLELCDDVLLHDVETTALENQNVTDVVSFFEKSIQNWVELSQDKMSSSSSTANRETSYKTIYNPRKYSNTQNSLDMPGQRNSLPDIPLTPREREILEQTHGPVNLVRNSHSSESILRDTSPPPKPPLPDNICFSKLDSKSGTPPPIPPKKRIAVLRTNNQLLDDCCGSFDNALLGCSSFDRVSLRSRSPEDSSSLLSASAGSLDSVLMQSRDEEEMRGLIDPKLHEDTVLQSDISDIMEGTDSVDCSKWSQSRFFSDLDNSSNTIELQQAFDGGGGINRLSNTESGFGSLRSSVQSYQTSKRNSQQSSNSSKWSNYSKQQIHTSESILENLNMKSEKSQEVVSSSSSIIKRETSIQSFSKSVSSATTVTNISELSNTTTNDGSEPPELPVKTRFKKCTSNKDRRPSQYDNVQPEISSEHIVTCAMHQQADSSIESSSEIRPPPLPPKKKHIMAYMEMFGNCSHTQINNGGDFLRHSMHTYNLTQSSEWQNSSDSQGEENSLTTASSEEQHRTIVQQSLTSTQSCSFNVSSDSISPIVQQRLNTSQVNYRRPVTCSPAINTPEPSPSTPPALPPKKLRAKTITPATASPPVSPQPLQVPSAQNSTSSSPLNSEQNIFSKSDLDIRTDDSSSVSPSNRLEPNTVITAVSPTKRSTTEATNNYNDNETETEILNFLDCLDVWSYLILKKQDEDGPDIRGGHIDALIVHATKNNKHDFKYQEAFLTTYRTFLSPLDLVCKLRQRYERFSCHTADGAKQRAARESFSLLVSVVSDLTTSDLDNKLLQTLMDFVYQLVCNGNLVMAKALRVKILEKYAARQLQLLQMNPANNQYLTSINTRVNQSQLLDFKSEQIAEQMTLLDADLFLRIEIPEVLIWAQEQKEERSPNLTCFTEHFNKMSYWARTRILEQHEAKDRERYVVKFIKIMKYLRKMNNFNSYLALLSALDSAPIRRLEWQKQITEGLKEYCALIDSSSSFRAYRQALSETHPPCIPYIGLILQDLTFVHIGNSDLLSDGNINFSKRWQQFNIVDNMKRFKKGAYPFKKQEKIVSFFNNFDDFMCEEKMWQISESIKPRGGRKQPS